VDEHQPVILVKSVSLEEVNLGVEEYGMAWIGLRERPEETQALQHPSDEVYNYRYQ